MDAGAVERVAVVGAGPTGRGVATVAALGGLDVTLRGLTAADAERGRERVEQRLDRLVDRGRLRDGDASAALARVDPHADVGRAVSGADLVVEAVPDRWSVKRDLYDALAGLPPDRAVLATAGVGWQIDTLAPLTDRPARFCGLRTFAPVVRREVAEVVGGPTTTTETLDLVAGVADRLGRTVVRLPGDPLGGVVDRVLAPAVSEAAWLVTAGDTPAAVDASARAVGLGVGPLAVADRTGLDRHLAVLDRLAEDVGPAYDAAPALRDRVKDGRLGAKTGGGFHGDGAADAPEADERSGLRLLAVLARETATLDAEGVADPRTVDRAVCLATGLARGPARLADETGLDRLVAALDEAREATDEPRYGRAGPLRERATAGRSFYPDATGPDDPTAGVRVDRPAAGVARVTLDRPGQANALDLAAARAVARAVEALAEDPAVRAVVLTGAGGQFCVGVDVDGARLATRNRASATRFAREGQRALGRVASAPVPVVAAVDGACLGAGLTLAACADLRVASERATFCHPARNLGLAPAWGGGARLPPVLGESRATELLLTGDRYDAARLHDDGFLTDVCADAEACAERALALAADLAAGSPPALSAIRASVRSERPTAALAAEAEAFGRLVVTDAARAALRSDPPGE